MDSEKPVRAGRRPNLDRKAAAYPLRETVYQLLDERPDLSGLTALGKRIAPGRHDEWLGEALRNDGGLADHDLDAVLGWDWAPEQRARLVRADHRAQARAGLRRRRYVHRPRPPMDLVVISAYNYDQIVPLPVFRSDHRPAATPGVLTFSLDAEIQLTTEPEFEEQVRRIQRSVTGSGDIFHRTRGGSGYNVAWTVHGMRPELGVAPAGVVGAVPASWPVDPVTGGRHETHRQALATVNLDLLDDIGDAGGRCASVVHLEGLRVQRTLFTWTGANVRFAEHFGGRFWDVVDVLANARAVHVTSLLDPESPGLLADLLTYAKRNNNDLSVSIDPGHVWATGGDGVDEGAVAQLIGLASVLFVSEGELSALAMSYAGVTDMVVSERVQAEAILAKNADDTRKLVVVKHRGAASLYRVGYEPVNRYIDELRPDELVDDTGAGDAFAAGFLGSTLTGGTMEDAADAGLRMARAKLLNAGPIDPGTARQV